MRDVFFIGEAGTCVLYQCVCEGGMKQCDENLIGLCLAYYKLILQDHGTLVPHGRSIWEVGELLKHPYQRWSNKLYSREIILSFGASIFYRFLKGKYVPNISGEVSAFFICSAAEGPCFGDISGELGRFWRLRLKGLNRAVLSSLTSNNSAIRTKLEVEGIRKKGHHMGSYILLNYPVRSQKIQGWCQSLLIISMILGGEKRMFSDSRSDLYSMKLTSDSLEKAVCRVGGQAVAGDVTSSDFRHAGDELADVKFGAGQTTFMKSLL